MGALIGTLLILAGVFNAAAPYTALYLELGWRYKDTEPSKCALVICRIVGILAIFLGVAFFIFA